MEIKDKYLTIFEKLGDIFPDAKCELNYSNEFELLIAVTLSAQTTDISVNKVTPVLFKKFPTPLELSKANNSEVLEIIKPLGLANNKSKNIIALSKKLVDDYDLKVPNSFDELITLPGVGRKTANVVLSEGFRIPRIAVDTHVLRVSNRLGLAKSENVVEVEEILMKNFPEEVWHLLHHRLIFFGRYLCKAKNPLCEKCLFNDMCDKK